MPRPQPPPPPALAETLALVILLGEDPGQALYHALRKGPPANTRHPFDSLNAMTTPDIARALAAAGHPRRHAQADATLLAALAGLAAARLLLPETATRAELARVPGLAKARATDYLRARKRLRDPA